MAENEKYLEMPWSIEDTIENLKEIKEHLRMKVLIQNLHGKGEKDAEEVAFDFDRAIQALEEIQQYRAIGTVEEFKVLKEKNEPKKPIYEADGYADGELVYDYAECPICGHDFEDGIND